MQKMKTKRAVAKRFKITGGGKLKFKKSGLGHNLSKKSRDKKRPKKIDGMVHHADRGVILPCLPYR